MTTAAPPPKPAAMTPDWHAEFRAAEHVESEDMTVVTLHDGSPEGDREDPMTLVTVHDASPEGDSPEHVLSEVADFIANHVVLPDEHTLTAVVLWVFHCHLIDHADSTPRLGFMAPEKGCGKTRAQEVIETLVPNPLRSSTVTTAVLFRSIGSDEPPTVFLDEVDAVWTGKGINEELRALVNSGHRRGNDALRMVGEGANQKMRKFGTFAPVCMAGIGELPDTITDRSIIVNMRRRLPHEKVARWRFRQGLIDGGLLRERIITAARSLTLPDEPEVPESVEDRAADVWEPLLAVAEAVGGDWHRAAVVACEVLTAAQPTTISAGVRLLTDIRTIWTAGATAMPTGEILRRLHVLDESPWGQDPPLTARRLALMLRRYGVQPDRTSTERVYQRSVFTDPWARYCPPSENPS